MDKDKIFLERQAEEIGCWGLVEGIAYNVYKHTAVNAATATKNDGPFYCKSCLSDAVIRKCTERRDHFAHKARLSPTIPKGEGELHRKCKKTICESLKLRFPEGKWEIERAIKKNERLNISGLRPDISGIINGQRLAIEIQASNLTVSKIVSRTESYAKWGISLLWIVPLIKEIGNSPIRPRQYERYLHSIYYGRVYYWWEQLGETLVPVHFSLAKRYIELAEWYEDGELIQVGGYYKPYKIVKTPLYGKVLNIAEDFSAQYRQEFIPKNERKSVPACSIWMDNHKIWWKTDKYINDDDN